MNLYTFQWAPPTNKPAFEILARNLDDAWWKATEACDCESDEIILLYVADSYQEDPCND